MRLILRVLVLLTLAGVAATTHAGFKAANSDELAPDLQLVSAEFGIVKQAEDGTIQIIPEKKIPLVFGQQYGWRLRFRTARKLLALREEFVLPAAPRAWGSERPSRDFKLTPDRKTATTEGVVMLTDGMIQHAWSVANGDPAGDYEIRLFIEGKLVRTFRFEVAPPK